MEIVLDPAEINYKVTVVRYDVNDFATYLIKIIGPKDIAFHIRDRYSLIREWYSRVKTDLPNKQGLPEFPGKKMFGNLDPNFL